MHISNGKAAHWKTILELVDPVAWVKSYAGFVPWPYEEELLRDNHIKTRIVRKARQIGITTTIAHEAVWKAYTSKERVILIISPSLRQSLIVMAKIQATIDSDPHLASMIFRRNKSEVHLKNGSLIAATPNNPDRIRGYAATDIYLDEAAHFLNDEPVMRAIKPMLIATKGTFTVVSTPFGKRGLFWDQYQIATNRKGLVSGAKAYDFYPSTISPLITEADLKRERLNLTDLEFRQEYLGEFLEEVDVYLPMDLIAPCVDHELELLDKGESSKNYMMGVDFAKRHDETVVILLEEVTDKLIVRHISAWSHMNYSQQIGRIKELSNCFRIRHAAADQTGVGEAVIEQLQEAVSSVEGVKFTQRTKVELVTSLRQLLEQRLLVLPNDRKLIMQLNSLRYTVSRTGNLLFESPEKGSLHDDYLWALALAIHAVRTQPRGYRGPPHTAVAQW